MCTYVHMYVDIYVQRVTWSQIYATHARRVPFLINFGETSVDLNSTEIYLAIT